MVEQVDLPSFENVKEAFDKFAEKAENEFFDVLRPELVRFNNIQLDPSHILNYYLLALSEFIGPVVSTVVGGFQDATVEEKVKFSGLLLTALSKVLNAPEFKEHVAFVVTAVQQTLDGQLTVDIGEQTSPHNT